MNHPTQLGKYPITGVLGKGAMGVVYRALDPVIERPVAIKTVHRALLAADDPVGSFALRFRNEARSAGRLAHPGIVAVYEFGEDAQSAYIVMEYVPGRTLAQRLVAGPAPGLAETLALMEQLLDALAHAHAQGVWHRDIKPANLIIAADGRLKVSDFGIARLADVALTQTLATIGTPGYMAPEQYTGAAPDHRIDLFAAGAVLYRLLAGRPAFSGAPDAVMYQILNESPVAPSRFGAPPIFDAVVEQALARDPAQRFADAPAFRDALRAAAGAGPDQTTRVLPPPVPAPAAFEPAELQAVEAALATAIGPVARVLVRQAARSAVNRSALLASLAGQIGEPASRASFLARLGQPGRPPAGAETPQTAGAAGLDAALLEHATRVLTTRVGPIAKVLVRKAAARCGSAEQLFELLAEDTAAGAERDGLMRRLRGRA